MFGTEYFSRLHILHIGFSAQDTLAREQDACTCRGTLLYTYLRQNALCAIFFDLFHISYTQRLRLLGYQGNMSGPREKIRSHR